MTNTANTVNNAPQGLFHLDNFDTFLRIEYEEVGNKENSGVNMLTDFPAANNSVTIGEYKDTIIDYLNSDKDYSVELLFAERNSTISEKSVIFNVDGMVRTKFDSPFSGAIRKDSKNKSFTVKAEIVFMQKRTSQKSVAISGEKLNFLENLPRKNNAVTGELIIKEVFSNKEDSESMYTVEEVENLSTRTEKIARILDVMNNDEKTLGYKRNFDVSTLLALDNDKTYVEITGQIELTKGLICPSAYDVVFKVII